MRCCTAAYWGHSSSPVHLQVCLSACEGKTEINTSASVPAVFSIPLRPAGFFKGVGKGVIGAVAQPTSGVLDFASSAFEGIDATKDQLIGRPRAGTVNKRLRLPRAIGGDGKVTAFIGSDGTEKEVSVWKVRHCAVYV